MAIGELSVKGEVMWAHDLSGSVNWRAKDPFAMIERYLNRDWAAQDKLDGCRTVIELGMVRNIIRGGRNGASRSANFPHLSMAVIPELAGCVMDGELVAARPRGGGNPLLTAATALMNSSTEHALRLQDADGPARLYVFDLLAVKGMPATALTWTQRQAMLVDLVGEIRRQFPACQIYRLPSHAANRSAIEAALRRGHEGVVLKRRSSGYRPGTRSHDWLKVKRVYTASGIITGYTPGQNANAGLVGSVELSLVEPDGVMLTAVGSVGGLRAAWRRQISAPDGSLREEWYGKVIEFKAQGVTTDGRVRHPQMVRLRPDQGKEDCGIEQLDAFARV